jgi:colanic acid/amylovoran biosynthesis glycosyltransferase
VLAVVSDFPAPSQTFIQRKLRGLSDAGFDIAVAAERFEPAAAAQGYDLVPLTPWKHPGAALATAGLRGTAALGRAFASAARPAGGAPSPLRRRALVAPLLATPADIVHFEFSGIAAVLADQLARLRPAHLVVSCRGAAEQIVPLRDPSRADALRKVFAEVDLVHCVSDDLARTAESFGAPPERIVVNRPAIPVDDFAPLATRRVAHGGPVRILSVGRLHWKKGFDDALRSVAAVVAAGVEVEHRIAGEGPEREKLSFLRHQLALDGTVSLLGTTPQAEVAELLAWADLLVLPSLSEGISNAVLEAMAAGLPVVVTECGGMREVVDDGVDGFVVPVGDRAALAERVVALARDEGLRRRVGAAAAARARREFDISRQVAVFDRAYRSLLGAPAG